MVQRPFGQKAREYLRLRLPIDRPVTLNVQTTDCYGRTVAEMFSDININLALVEDGQGLAHRKHLGREKTNGQLESNVLGRKP